MSRDRSVQFFKIKRPFRHSCFVFRDQPFRRVTNASEQIGDHFVKLILEFLKVFLADCKDHQFRRRHRVVLLFHLLQFYEAFGADHSVLRCFGIEKTILDDGMIMIQIFVSVSLYADFPRKNVHRIGKLSFCRCEIFFVERKFTDRFQELRISGEFCDYLFNQFFSFHVFSPHFR